MAEDYFYGKTFDEAAHEYMEVRGRGIRPVLLRVPEDIDPHDFIKQMKEAPQPDSPLSPVYAVMTKKGHTSNAVHSKKIYTKDKGRPAGAKWERHYVIYQADKNGYMMPVGIESIKSEAEKIARERAKMYNRAVSVKYENLPKDFNPIVFEAIPSYKGLDEEQMENEYFFFQPTKH